MRESVLTSLRGNSFNCAFNEEERKKREGEKRDELNFHDLTASFEEMAPFAIHLEEKK